MSFLTCKVFEILHFRGIIIYQLVKKTIFMGYDWIIANLILSGFIIFSVTGKVYFSSRSVVVETMVNFF